MKDQGKSVLMALMGGLSALWLLNPIPLPDDLIPILGNFDEAAAATLLIAALAYFGLDITKLFGRAKQFNDEEKKDVPSRASKEPVRGREKMVDAKVVEHH